MGQWATDSINEVQVVHDLSSSSNRCTSEEVRYIRHGIRGIARTPGASGVARVQFAISERVAASTMSVKVRQSIRYIVGF